MSSKTSQSEERVVARDRDDTLTLILSMADTTWRMFTPPAITVTLGIFGDLRFHTKPWITITAAAAGLVLSVLLVRKQLREVR